MSHLDSVRLAGSYYWRFIQHKVFTDLTSELQSIVKRLCPRYGFHFTPNQNSKPASECSKPGFLHFPLLWAFLVGFCRDFGGLLGTFSRNHRHGLQFGSAQSRPGSEYIFYCIRGISFLNVAEAESASILVTFFMFWPNENRSGTWEHTALWLEIGLA